ncbi:FHA domain-containing protein [Holdemanella porci]|uniref:FHA domain-containing protein n=1 Tax=Holdemanella porci TaxID=2652276 RepID=UPI003AEF7038
MPRSYVKMIGTYIQDLKSTNKTYLNEKEVKRKMRLKDGMTIRFGDVVCEFKEQ